MEHMSEYGSHSQLSTFSECGRRYELERVSRVPRRPGYWFPGGTAIHATIEAYLREAVKCESAAETAESSSATTATENSSTPVTDSTDATPTQDGPTPTPSLIDVDELFRRNLDWAFREELSQTTFSPDEWFTAGRGKGEDLAWWIDNGAAIVWNFINWYEANPDFTVWIAPDGRPAIELDLTVAFGTVPVRMVIDTVFQVGRLANPALVVVDFKSGSTKPKGARQLGIYASGLEREYGIRPRYGSYFMARGTGKDPESLTFFQPVTELSAPQYSYEYLTGEFQRFSAARAQGLFLASPGESCRRCGVAHACAEVGGEEASRLDPNYPRKAA
jgi:putative RecB family exonuclease